MGRAAVMAILVAAALTGGLIYYAQVYRYYERVTPDLTVTLADGRVVPLAVSELEAIDAASSPIRFRACFAGAAVPADAMPYRQAEPLVAPGWFDCFDAAAIGGALEAGTARAYLGQRDVIWGVDRVIAVTDSGAGHAWHQINPCGRAVFDGRAAPPGCPERPAEAAARPEASTGY